MSNVDSAAILLFLAGDKRVSVKNSRFLIHESKASGQYVDMTQERLQEQVEVMKSVNEAYAGIIADRIEKPKLTCKKWMKSSGVMNAEKALERGFIEDIVSEDFIPVVLSPDSFQFTITITDPISQQQVPQQTTLSF